MRWLIYDTQSEAEAADAAISAAMGLPRPGVNAATGEPDFDVVTSRWAAPQELRDGRWTIPSPDEAGVELPDDAWPGEVIAP